MFLKKGLLTQYGYHAHNTKKNRQVSLKRALAKSNFNKVFKEINALFVLSKRRPILRKIYKQDLDWLKKIK